MSMQLIGGFRSPYVRRVAVSLNLMGFDWASKPISAFDEPDAVKAHNPVVRIPTLVLDDGDTLVESWAILDWLDEEAGPDRALLPPRGVERRRAYKTTAVGVACMDKAVWAAYEFRSHPKEKVHRPWVEHNEAQVLGGFEWLDQRAKAAGDGWLDGGQRIGQSDVTAAVAFTFVSFARPKVADTERFPNLARLAARCEEMPEFARVHPDKA